MEQENNLPEEEETGILTLTDENGQDANFEYLDCIEYQDTEYLVLMPEGEDEIVILEVEPVERGRVFVFAYIMYRGQKAILKR